MADEDDKLEVEIVDAPSVTGAPAAAPAAKVVTESEGIEDLKARLAAAERRAEQSEQRVREVANVADQQITRANQGDIALIEAGISTAQREIEIAKANKKAYMARQDFDHAAEMDDLITQHRLDLQELQRGREALSAQIEQAKQSSQRQAPSQNDPVETMAASVSPRSATWIRAHPEYARDERLKTKMIGAHYKAIGDGIEPDSDSYFSYVERELGIGKGGVDDADSPPLSSAARGRHSDTPPPSAPVSRAGTGDGTSVNRRVRLTKEEAEIAKMSGQTPEEYYRAKEALKREGRILN